ncbi:Early nodulin-like protein [Musa troglodytarum]|uniref:Early nodulin-like protein n=1 Tax=Musa troglodytarum TaxID=320322 RepID=A0A9E7I850_9LILI|nr:Early nodulin-like protein [Musa troglodytarum]
MASTPIVLVGVLLGLVASGSAYEFHVGGSHGWVEHHHEKYNSWAERNRFQVNDTLLFKYKAGEDSVLVVTDTAYKSCNVTNPIESYTDGNTVFKFNRSGPFFFISGAADHCKHDQRLIVVVLAIRNHKSHGPTPSPPGPSSSASGLAVSRVYLGAMVAVAMALGQGTR